MPLFSHKEDQTKPGSCWTPSPRDINWENHPTFNPEKQPGLVCPCGCGKAIYDEEFLRKLESVHRHSPEDFRIVSGYRCESSKAKIRPDGAQGCAGCCGHTSGIAVDLAIKDDEHRARLLHRLLSAGIRRLGIGSDFIHVDGDMNKEQRVAWLCCMDRKTASDRVGFEDSAARFTLIESYILKLGVKSFNIGSDFIKTETHVTKPASPDPQDAIRFKKYQERQAAAEQAPQSQEADLTHALMNERLASALMRGIYRDKLSREEILATFGNENNLTPAQVEEMAAAVSV